MRFRGVGGLTGSRIAVSFARVPILDLVHHHSAPWTIMSFHGSLSVATWIDNLYAAADTPFKSVSILNEAEAYLDSRW